MNDRKIEFIKASVLGMDYWKDKTTNGSTNEQKLKTEFEDIYKECCQDKEIQEEIEHVKNLLNNKPRKAGFGGWIEYVPSSSKKQKELYDKFSQQKRKEFDDCVKNGKKRFVEWYFEEVPQQCCYCGVSKNDVKSYFEEYNPNETGQTKKAYERGRGYYLEVERVRTDSEKTNIYNSGNCALACYICNNAKSDFISPKDFKSIAKGINEFWQKVLAKEGIDISYLTDFKSIWERVEKKLNNQK